MKKLCIVLLTLALLLPCVAGLTSVTSEAAAAEKPFYMLNTMRNGNPANVQQLTSMTVELKIAEDGTRNVTLKYSGKTGTEAVAALKKTLNAMPAGTRYLRVVVQDALLTAAEDVVYFDSAVAPMKAAFEEFFKAYKAAGGLIDGVLTDEDLAKTAGVKSPVHWYLHASHFSGGTNNKNIYRDIVENPLYEETIRPLLEERGFMFYPQDESAPEKSEIYSIYPYDPHRDSYAPSRQIWDAVIKVRIAEHLTEAVYKPLIASFPDALMGDRQSRDLDGWMKEVNTEGGSIYLGGSLQKAGNASCYNNDDRMLMDGKTFPSMNDVSVTMNAFFQVKWDVNQFKNIYESTDTGNVFAWMGDYGHAYQGIAANKSYYTEIYYHLALQGVDTFFGALYNEKGQHATVNAILTKLNALVGTADRKPIDLPLSWNYDFIVSGMTAGGKNYYRITPDVDLVELEAFKVSGTKDPTFTVNGQTVTFPGGKILAEATIPTIGSCGYWVETATNVYPSISCSADRYTQQPPYLETFDTALDVTYWKQEGTPANVEEGKLVATGATTLQSLTYPQRVSAGDLFAPQQRWKVTVTIPAGLNDDAEMTLLTYTKKDTGFRIAQGKIWYDDGGNSRELLTIDFAAGGTYTLIREVDFTVKGMYLSDYYVYGADGKLLASQIDSAMLDATLPYASLNMAWTRLRAKVLLDDYTLYPTSHTASFELFDSYTGIASTTTGQKKTHVGYRMTWLNATEKTEKAEVIAAHYDANGKLVEEEVLETITMGPGTDGVVTGLAKRKHNSVYVYLKEYEKAYVMTIGNSGRGAEGVGKYRAGETVTVNAGNRPGYSFVGWTCDKDVTFSDPKNPETSFVMPEGDTVVSANWELIVIEGVKPFVMTNWGSVDEALYSNIRNLVQFFGKDVNGQYILTYKGYSDIPTMAKLVKEEMDGRPDGTRWINGGAFGLLIRHYAEDVIYLEKGVEIMRSWLDEFLAEYKRIGGKLDGVALDIEYFHMEYWYLHAWHFSGGTNNRFVYHDIVTNPNYETKVRPMLAERGFKFYPNPNQYTPEIYGIYPNAGDEYQTSRMIWDACMQTLLSEYQNESMAPLFDYYPDADVNDYTKKDMVGWLKRVDETGGKIYLGGNAEHMGTASSMNTYSYAPSLTFERLAGQDYVYNKMPSYNKAVYEDDPYNMFMWDVNDCKTMRLATPSKQVSVWFAAYCYSPERPGSTSFTPYYAEAILHMGLLDPQPFLGFIVGNHDGRMETSDEYNLALQVASDILAELTRIVGAEDRKPIDLPINWNNGYMLSGMYAGGKNYWRITPDTTDGMTKEAFLISKEGEDPTFSINGQTITFPGGKIIADGVISEVGTCGYWIETSTDMTMPTITYANDRYSQVPSFKECFDEYQLGMNFNGPSATNKLTWDVFSAMNGICQIMEDPNNKNNQMLGISGLTSLKNIRMPQNITAGDSFAKQQMWEVTAILPADMDASADLRLFTIFSENFSDDGGMQIMGNKVKYDQSGEYVEMAGVELTAGVAYTFKRELNFTDAANFTSSYYIYDAEGKLVGEAKDIPILEMPLPINGIGLTCNGVTGDPILLDSYKLYPIGLTKEFEVYNANTGIMPEDQTAAQANNAAFRLSWLNATNETASATVMAAFYDAEGKLVKEEEVKTFQLTANADGVETGIVELKEDGQTLKVYLKSAQTSNEPGENPGGTDGKSSSLGLIIGICAGVLVVIAAAVVVVIVLKKKKPTNPAA